VEWYVVELTESSDPLTDIAIAARYLESLSR